MIRSYSTLDERLRHAMLSEYLTVRALREDARRDLIRADEADALQSEDDRQRAWPSDHVPYRTPSLRAGYYRRQHAERTRAMADGAMAVVARMRGVLRGGY